NFQDRNRLSRTYVDDFAVGFAPLHGQHAGANNVMNAYEVPHLLSVFKYKRRLSIQQTGGENSSHSGVGVREGLACSVNVKEAERRDRQPVGAAKDKAHLLLVAFGKGVERIDLRRLGFIGGTWFQRAPAM